jgi:hypothetical protein
VIQLILVLTMKKTALLLSGILLCSSFLFMSQPALAMGDDSNSTQIENLKRAKPQTKKTVVKKPKKSKTSKAASGRCKNPTDRDARGKLCGKRAASARAGGS